MNLAPVVLFVYNRPLHTAKVVEALQKNTLAGESELYIFSDGARGNKDKSSVEQVRKYLKTIRGFKQTVIIERQKNLGLAESVITGVTEIVNKIGKVIVLEDDLLTSPYFLRYMNDALDLYLNDEKVISVHGYVYPIKAKLPETFFLRGADCWGWATWKRGWELFEADGKTLIKELRVAKLVRSFDYNGSYPFTQMLNLQIAGLNNSWAIRWYASAFLANKLTLYPGLSLVKNIGFDNSGKHSGKIDWFAVELINRPVKVGGIKIEEDQLSRKKFERYFKRPKIRLLTSVMKIRGSLRLIEKNLLTYGKNIKAFFERNPMVYNGLNRFRHLIVRSLRPGFAYLLFANNKPISDYYGLDRGKPIDRYFIEKFVEENSGSIQGECLELLDNKYTLQFGTSRVTRSNILDINKQNKRANIFSDLRKMPEVPSDYFDCIILTQVFQFVDDLDSAISECYRILKPGGVLLVTVPSVSRVDCISGQQNDFWRFTTASVRYIFEKRFQKEKLLVKSYGSALANSLFMLGFSCEEINISTLEKSDPNFPTLICAKAVK